MLGYLDPYGPLIVSMVLGAVLALSLYLPFMAGQLSLASPGFFLLGGYVAAILSTEVFATEGVYPVPLVLVEMVVAAVLCAALAAVVGLSALRLRGIYLALATIAFAEILRILALNLEVTGGAIGIFAIPQPVGTQLSYLWLAGPLLVAAMLLTRRLERVNTGRAFVAIREDELAAAAMGIDLTRAKVTAFVLGGVLAGLAGVVAAHQIESWSHRQGTFEQSILYLSFVLIGGSRIYLGPVAGGLALTYLPEWLRGRADSAVLPVWLEDFLREGRLIVFGVLIAIGCIFFPQGFITPETTGKLRRLARRVMGRRLRDAGGPPGGGDAGRRRDEQAETGGPAEGAASTRARR